ncbi:hypothetical protein MRB53_030874 [Persea americana]|uniref:Uncharacterized protein n=1 Tax=Persea americana TaxID=3435 RepID=A0ACC2KMV1_PERAE|nr:hypothetical protein MRB53_030874 [Persea americana]
MGEQPVARLTTPPGYTSRNFLFDHMRTLFHNMSDWSTDELRRSPEHLNLYLGLLRRTGYGTLNAVNLLRLISYWASVVGVMEGMTNKLLAVHVIQWEALNSHFKLVELNHTLVIAERQLTEASEVLQRLRVRREIATVMRCGWQQQRTRRERCPTRWMDYLEALMDCASRGVLLEPLVGAGVDVAIDRGFRGNVETSLRVLLDRASWIL